MRRKLTALASLFDYLLERNAMPGFNPVHGVKRPKLDSMRTTLDRELPHHVKTAKNHRFNEWHTPSQAGKIASPIDEAIMAARTIFTRCKPQTPLIHLRWVVTQ